jgi:serine/threonine protein kinase
MTLCINPSCDRPNNPDNQLFCQNCGSELLLGGKYRVVRVLSKKGGFANTYEVTDQKEPRVLKVLKSDNPKAIELFDREFQVLASLNCPGMPQVYDSFLYYPRNSQQALHCLSMEKIEGIDLEEYVKVLDRPIDQKTAINWLGQLARILESIHSRGIFHRDIKPSNIILQPDGQLVLIDFGAVKQTTSTQGNFTQIYTPGYAAPEQERGIITPQSDFFSLGRTFVYLLTTKEPTELYSSYSDRVEWRDQTRNAAPELLNLIDRLMENEARLRPDSTATILQAIGALPTQQSKLVNHQSPSPQSKQITTISAPNNPLWRYPVWLLPLIGLGLLASIAAYFLKDRLFSPGTPASTGQYFSAVRDVPTGEFKFGGSTTWATTRQTQSSLDAAIQGALPQFKLVYTDADPTKIQSVADGKCPSKPGSNTGICLLIQGDLDFAQSSVSLEKSTYADRVTQYNLKDIPVAYDALTIVVNPQLNIPGLTIQQLRDIYTGTVTNWNQVGGPNLPIVAFSRDLKAGGTVSSFQDLVLGKDSKINFDFVKTVRSPQAGLQQTKANPGGIFYGSAKETIVDFCDTKPLAIGNSGNNLIAPYQLPLQSPSACQKGKRNQINVTTIKSQAYPLTRKIYTIYKADGANSQKAGEAYTNLLLTQQGQELLEKAGFVRINN